MDCSTSGLLVHHQFLEFTQTHVHWVGDAIQPSHPLSSPSPAFNISQHQGFFKWVSSSHQMAKYWSLSLIISPSSDYSGLISFRLDWLDLLAVQGTLKSLHHHNSKASILRCSAVFIVQLSHPYTTTGKTIALTRWNFQKRFRWNIQKTKIMASGPITSWQIDGVTVSDFYFFGLQNHWRWWLQLKDTYSLEGKLWPT